MPFVTNAAHLDEAITTIVNEYIATCTLRNADLSSKSKSQPTELRNLMTVICKLLLN